MQRKAPTPTPGRHAVDKRKPAGPSRTAHFLRLSRTQREVFHTVREPAGNARLMHFLRIARGRLA